MQLVIEDIKRLFQSFSKAAIVSIDKIPQSGSDRIYFRIITDSRSYIATYNTNLKENETFLYFSKHFKQCGCPVPEVFAINNEHSIYIQ